MIKHIVVWRLRESAHGNDKRTNALLIKEKLEALRDKIPGLLKFFFFIDSATTESSADIALYSEFVSREALDAYQTHPAHKAIMPFVGEARTERRMVDYEM